MTKKKKKIVRYHLYCFFLKTVMNDLNQLVVRLVENKYYTEKDDYV